MIDRQRKRTNQHHSRLADQIAKELDDAGYEHVWPAYLIFAMRDMRQAVYARQVEVGRDIYGKIRRVDFLLFHPYRHPNGLVIQCRWQAVSGSVEQKYPFEVECLKRGEFDGIIVLDGGGFSPGSEQWLRSQAGQNRLKHVFNLDEFQKFVMRGNL